MKTLISLSICMFIVACAPGEVELPSAGSLEGGTWATACVSKDGFYQKREASFSDGAYRESIAVYADAGCQQSVITLGEEGSYLIRGEFSGTSMIMLDRIYSKLTVTPMSSSLVNSYNTNSYCGFSDWVLGTSKNVTGLTCDGSSVPAAGTIYYDLYYIDQFTIPETPGVPGSGSQAGDLQFGYVDVVRDGSTEDKRPDSVTSPAYRKQ